MNCKTGFSCLALAICLIISLGGCASSEVTQPAPTSYMKSAVGTPNELSPMAPPEARNVRKVGNHWVCEIKGRTMIYNDAAACWEPQQK